MKVQVSFTPHQICPRYNKSFLLPTFSSRQVYEVAVFFNDFQKQTLKSTFLILPGTPVRYQAEETPQHTTVASYQALALSKTHRSLAIGY